MTYILNEKKFEGCIFCDARKSLDGFENLVVSRGQYAYVICNRYPYTSGHLMVVPFIHHPELDDFNPETRAEMMELTAKCVRVLRNVYKAQGFNIGANIGSAAGAGVPKHFHLHIVPRWEGDTNFMSAVGETRVLPEALEETYKRVRGAWSLERKT